MWRDMISALKAMDFERLQQILSRLDVTTFLSDPWVIGAIALISLVLLIRGMGKLLISLLSIPALLVLFEKTVQADIDLEKSGYALLYFAGGFLIIAGINVYVHFIRS